MSPCTVPISLPLWVMKAQQEERQRNYQHLLATDDQHLILNTSETDCPICFSPLQQGEGIVLRECLHTFCRSDTEKSLCSFGHYLQNMQNIIILLISIFVFFLYLYVCPLLGIV